MTTQPTLQERVASLLALAEKQEGPWKHGESDIRLHYVQRPHEDVYTQGRIILSEAYEPHHVGMRPELVDFLVAARNAMPALLADLLAEVSYLGAENKVLASAKKSAEYSLGMAIEQRDAAQERVKVLEGALRAAITTYYEAMNGLVGTNAMRVSISALQAALTPASPAQQEEETPDAMA